MKVLKYALLGLAALALVAAIAIAYLAFTFDPRDYQPRIVELVREKTGRTLDIAGEIRLSVWPDLGIRLGAVSLSERGSDERFADVENVRLTVKLMPLLSRELTVEELLVQGAHVRVTRFSDGRLNIDDLFKSEGGTPAFDVGRVKLERSAITYRDLSTGKQYEVSDISLETGRVANAVATPLKAAFSASDTEHTFDVTSALEGRLTVDPGRQRYAFDEAALVIKGHVAGVTSAVLQVKGSFAADLKGGEFKAAPLSAVISGTTGGETIDVSVAAAAAVFGPTQAYAEPVTASVRASGATGATRVDLEMSRLQREADTISATAAAWELDLRRGTRTVQLSTTSAIEASISQRTLQLTRLDTKLSASGAPLPGKGVTGAFTGKASLDIAKEGVHASLNGRIDESRIKAEIDAAGFAAPVYTFAVEIDQLDTDRYAAATPARKSSTGALDVSSLSELPATGTLSIGVLKTAGVKASNVRLVIKP
jgi:AsmA protein